ncbi:uncharacterized protein LOC135297830 [Passer domesticus]|uniref:uncharacterized protein LOC135297830 n=1 Tax=Passer domesticus TaxID=48849 RepID=UPI0030FF1341
MVPIAVLITWQLLIQALDQSLVTAWIVPQPRKNVWVTLAHALNQDHLCLSTPAADNPMSTCLVGIPFQLTDFPSSLVNIQSQLNRNNPSGQWVEIFRYWGVVSYVKTPITNPLELWRKWVFDLPYAEAEPQEFELLGSAKADLCVHFDFTPSSQVKSYEDVKQHKLEFRAAAWCAQVGKISAPSTDDGYPRKLDKGVFLICGDRAYPGIPSRLLGGPCTLGRLSLASPNMTQIPIRHVKKSTKIVKRGAEQLDEHCDSEIYHWAKSKRIAVSVFLPWVAAAKSLSELGNLECWVTHQANLTSQALSDLLADEEITRRATLQNRAAIDFLLLAHGHGCQEFEGLCCFNLTSRSKSIHASIQEMKDLVGAVKQESEDWFKDLFRNWGLSGWMLSLIKDIGYFVVILLLVALSFGVIKRIITASLTNSSSKSKVVIAAATTQEDSWWKNPTSRDTQV